ncbi:MAG: amino acid ABC transporter substrate-binding protein [Reyranella sp.]|nr:amino acid ABC transporter substrate-binding protein [Reyranella sp.]
MTMLRIAQSFSLLTLAVGALAAGSAAAGTLDDLQKSKTLRLAYREDAAPFAYKTPAGQPAGFMIELCQAVARDIAKQLNMPDLKVAYVPVTTADRLDAIVQNRADLNCDSLTQTIERRKVVDFSVPTFVDGATFAIRNDGPQDIAKLAGRKVGVIAGTLTEADTRKALAAVHVNAEVVAFKGFDEAMAALERGDIAAYFAGRAMLASMIKGHPAAARILLASTFLSIEPFALAMRRGDGDFRLAVDRALSHIYRSGEIATIYSKTFGPNDKPTPTLQSLYMIATLPE